MTRNVLVHLNVSVPDDDDRTPEEIGTAIDCALEFAKSEVVLDYPYQLDGLMIMNPLSEEIGATP